MSNTRPVVLVSGRSEAPELQQAATQRGYDTQFLPTSGGLHLLRSMLEQELHAVTATNDGGSVLAAYIAEQKGLRYPSVKAVTLCQHKLKSRDAQLQWIPQAVPKFTGITLEAFESGARPNLADFEFPLIVKPFRSSFSQSTAICSTEEEVIAWIEQTKEKLRSTNDTFRGFWNEIVHGAELDGFIIEERAQGWQVTLDGYVHNGQVRFVGITDSVLQQESLSFSRFEYPSSLDQRVQDEMRRITKSVLRGIGFDHGFFNVEFVTHPRDGVTLIEINSRPSMQFERLFEWVSGQKLIDMMMEEAVGGDPAHLEHGVEGEQDGVGFCHVFRRGRDGVVASVPTAEDIARAKQPFKNAYVYLFAQPNVQLSSLGQDPMSFRYAYAFGHVDNRIEVGPAIAHMEDMLPFTFSDVPGSPTSADDVHTA